MSIGNAIAGARAGMQKSRDARELAEHQTCTRCGWTGNPEKKAPGTMGKEIALWILVFPVGILYSIWRMVFKREQCPECNGTQFVPAGSVYAATIRKTFGRTWPGELSAEQRRARKGGAL